jgi:hypothetical protein
MEFCIGTCAKIDAVGLAKQAEDVGASHLSNPFTAERDIDDIGSSILAHA